MKRFKNKTSTAARTGGDAARSNVAEPRNRHRLLSGCIALICSLTFSPSALAYRTLGDELGEQTQYHWTGNTAEFVVQNPSSIGLDPIAVGNAASAAFATWTAPSCASLTTHYVGIGSEPPRPDDGINTIGWITSGWESLPTDIDAAGYTDILVVSKADGTSYIAEADIYINAQSWAWGIGTSSAYRDLRSVLLHEIGHFLGLAHPCETPATASVADCTALPIAASLVMNPIFDNGRLTLSSDDTNGICALYPKPVECSPACDVGQVCIAGACRIACGISSCNSDEVCLDSACVKVATQSKSCAMDNDCQQGRVCLPSGVCAVGDRFLGDPCSRDTECATGACSSQGFCGTACAKDSDCADGLCMNVAADDALGVCTSSLGGIGAQCSEANECLGNQCLAGTSHGPECTRLCGEGALACPAGWQCESVESRKVCVPQVLEGGGGCQIVGGASSRAPLAWMLGGLLAIGGVAIRRRPKMDVGPQPGRVGWKK